MKSRVFIWAVWVVDPRPSRAGVGAPAARGPPPDPPRTLTAGRPSRPWGRSPVRVGAHGARAAPQPDPCLREGDLLGGHRAVDHRRHRRAGRPGAAARPQRGPRGAARSGAPGRARGALDLRWTAGERGARGLAGSAPGAGASLSAGAAARRAGGPLGSQPWCAASRSPRARLRAGAGGSGGRRGRVALRRPPGRAAQGGATPERGRRRPALGASGEAAVPAALRMLHWTLFVGQGRCRRPGSAPAQPCKPRPR